MAPHRAIAVPRLSGGEGPGDDGHGLRRHQRGAEALEHAREDEQLDRAGETAPERRQREEGQPGQVDVLRAEPVAQPAGDQQRHGVGEQVRAGDPDDRVVVGVQVLPDRGGRDRHDRGVDQDHEEPDDHRPEGWPGVIGRRRGPGGPSRGHVHGSHGKSSRSMRR